MSSLPISISDEFIELCHTQVSLLEGIGATDIAVYITDPLPTASDLSESRLWLTAFSADPSWRSPKEPVLSLPEFWHRYRSEAWPTQALALPPTEPIAEATLAEPLEGLNQLVIPFIREDILLGVLVTARPDCPWQARELSQLENIAETLAISRFLDQANHWYQEQNRQFSQQQHQERQLWDDLLHQLRNPVAALRTFSKLLRRRLTTDDRNYSVAESMLRESERLQSLLATYSEQLPPLTAAPDNIPALPASPQAVSCQPLDLQELLSPILDGIRVIAIDKEQHFFVQLPARLPLVNGNAQQLPEVFNNLLENAVKYTPVGGYIAVGAQTTVDETGAWLGIAISDTGCGIPLSDQARIFERRYRSPQVTNTIAGTGLGLAIAADFTQQMNGHIDVISPNHLANQLELAEPAPGTTFIVWLAITENAQEKTPPTLGDATVENVN
ncbi:MAG: HAMP domain-containing sensor histidine kinase [Cyanobacteria bacterium P01_H01_bin.15]